MRTAGGCGLRDLNPRYELFAGAFGKLESYQARLNPRALPNVRPLLRVVRGLG